MQNSKCTQTPECVQYSRTSEIISLLYKKRKKKLRAVFIIKYAICFKYIYLICIYFVLFVVESPFCNSKLFILKRNKIFSKTLSWQFLFFKFSHRLQKWALFSLVWKFLLKSQNRPEYLMYLSMMKDDPGLSFGEIHLFCRF